MRGQFWHYYGQINKLGCLAGCLNMGNPMKLISWKIRIKNTYMHLLIILVSSFLISPFISHSRTATRIPVLSFILLAGIIFTLRTLNLRRRIFLLVLTIGLAWYLCELLLSFFIQGDFRDDVRIVSLMMYGIFLLATIVLLIYKMFSVTEVTGDTIMGGISVYLLLGFLWATFYTIIYFFDANAFHFSEHAGRASIFYFSFATLTTLGFGDIYPVNRLAMSLVSLEVITGQMYLAIFISRLVGLHLVRKSR
jgi:hypothetical protein